MAGTRLLVTLVAGLTLGCWLQDPELPAVSGLILDADTKSPIYRAEVFVYFENEGPNRHKMIQGFATTDADGRFHVPGMTISRFGPWFGWEGPGLTVFHREYGLSSKRNVPEFVFMLERNEASLELVKRRSYSPFVSRVSSSKEAMERMCLVVFGPGASCNGVEAAR